MAHRFLLLGAQFYQRWYLLFTGDAYFFVSLFSSLLYRATAMNWRSVITNLSRRS